MSEAGPTAIRLALFGGTADHIQRIVTFLRNGGLAVHGKRLNRTEELEQLLQNGECDLLIGCAFDPQIDPGRVLELWNEAERDIPLLIMSDERGDPVQLLQYMRTGARDLVDKDDLEHLQLVVAREFGDLQQRRELSELQIRLLESEQRCKGLIKSSIEPIAFIQDGVHAHVNPAYLDIFGLEDPSDIEYMPLLDMVQPQQQKALIQAMRALEGNPDKGSLTLDTTLLHQDGSSFEAGVYLAKANMDGEPCLQIIVRAKEEQPQDIEQKLCQFSRTDEDTQLPNRHHFLAQLDQWMDTAATGEDVPALLYLSLDHYQELRHKLGIQDTDELIRETADTLRQGIAGDDLLARFSDNNFTLLCHRPSANEIQQLADDLCAAMGALRTPGEDKAANPTLSIGVALMTDTRIESQDLINTAYNACETARGKGGNQAELPQPKIIAPIELSPQDSKVAQQVNSALADDRFRLAYQPIVSLQGDSRENYAVLVRMLDENQEELLPEFFIKQAEQAGKMVEIDRWIIRKAIANLSKQRREKRKVNFFINISEPTLKDKNTLLWVCDCLREYDARGGWLTFQIREKHARNNLKATARLIDGLKKIRCQIALDHFGLLSRPEKLLEKLDIDFVKLAPSFVRDINTNQEKQDELNALNQAILTHNCKTIATAVEDANSLTVLWTVGVGYIQGYFLQEPSESIEYVTQQLV